MSQQEKRALRQTQEPQRYVKIKLLIAFFVLVGAIATSNPSVSSLHSVSMENLMSTTIAARADAPDASSPPTQLNDVQVGSKVIAENSINSPMPTPVDDDDDEQISQCAICFFGLPRSYKELVLPSIVKNVLEPNFQYNCDIFVHYYARKKELKGRLNPGGEMDPTEIFSLASAVDQAYSNEKAPPTVTFVNDTERTFFDLRQAQIDKYLKKRDKQSGKKLYFPWKQKTWKRSSLVNLIRQWHSIDKVFHTMEDHMTQQNKQYKRVAMLRNDAMYLSPIDIFKLDNDSDILENNNTTIVPAVTDEKNEYFVIAPFAQYPVNDRMIYGPYEAIQVWSTKRFDLVEDRANDPKNLGNVMHSESFMEHSILPAMEALGYKRHTHPGLCFVRTRPDSKVLFNDCRSKGTARGFETTKATLEAMAPGVLGSNATCLPITGQKGNKANHLAQCSKMESTGGVDLVD